MKEESAIRDMESKELTERNEQLSRETGELRLVTSPSLSPWRRWRDREVGTRSVFKLSLPVFARPTYTV